MDCMMFDLVISQWAVTVTDTHPSGTLPSVGDKNRSGQVKQTTCLSRQPWL